MRVLRRSPTVSILGLFEKKMNQKLFIVRIFLEENLPLLKTMEKTQRLILNFCSMESLRMKRVLTMQLLGANYENRFF